MKIKVHCDDGYETYLQIPEDIAFDEVINEVENLRKTQGYDLSDVVNTATRNLSVAYQVHRTQNQDNKGNSSSLEFSDPQYVSRRLSVKTVISNRNEKNRELIVYLYGFKSQQQSDALQQLYQFSSKLSFLNVAFNQAIEKYTTHYPTFQGGYQNLLSPNGSSSAVREESNAAVSTSSRADQNPLEIVSNRLIEFSSDIQRLFDESLSRPNLDLTTRSTLIKAKNSFVTGDLATTISTLRFPSLHPEKPVGDSSSSTSFSLALVPSASSVIKEAAAPAKKGQKAAATTTTTTPKKDNQKKETPKKETKANNNNNANPASVDKTVAVVAVSSSSVPMEVEDVSKASDVVTAPVTTTDSTKDDNKPVTTAVKQNTKPEPKKKPEPAKKTENPAPNKTSAKKAEESNAAAKEEAVPKEETKTTTQPPKEIVAPTANKTKPVAATASAPKPTTVTKKEESSPSSSSESGSDSESDSDSSTSSGSTRVSSSSGSSGSTASTHTKTSSRSASPAGKKKAPSSTPSAKNSTSVEKKADIIPEKIPEKSDMKTDNPPADAATTFQTQPLLASDPVIDDLFSSPNKAKPSAKFIETPTKKATTPAVTSKPAESLATPSISTPAPALAAPVPPTLTVTETTSLTKPVGKAVTKANAQKDVSTSFKSLIGAPVKDDDVSDSDSDSEGSSGSGSGSSDDSDSDSSESRSDSEADSSSSDEEKNTSKKGLALTVQTSVKKPSGVSHTRTAETPSALMSLLAANPGVPGRLSLSQTPASAVKVPTSTTKIVEESESSSSSSDDEKSDEDDDVGNLPKFSPPPAVNTRRLRSNSKEDESKTKGGKVLPVTMKPSDKTETTGKKNAKNQKPKATGPSLRALVATTTPKEEEGKKEEAEGSGGDSGDETTDELVYFQPAPPKPSPKRRGAANKRNAASAGLSQGPPSSQGSDAPKGKGGKAATTAAANKRTRTTKSD